MIKKYTFLLLGLYLLVPFRLQAEVLTLEKALEIVLNKNADVQASFYRTEAAKAKVPQAKSLEDPEIGVKFDQVPLDTLDVNRGMSIDYSLEQKIPFPGKRYILGKKARYEAESVKALSRGSVRDVILDLKETYYKLYRIQKVLEVNDKNQSLLKQLFGSAEARYATGKTTAEAPLRAQVELSKLDNEEVLLQQEQVTHMAHLKALLNQESHESFTVSSKINWPHLRMSLEEVKQLAMNHRPELVSIRSLQKRDKAELTGAKQSLIPDLSVGFEYNQRAGINDAWTGTTSINLPVFFWGKNRGEIKEKKADLKATELEKQSMEIHTQHEIEQAYSAVKAAATIIASYQNKILPQSKTTLNTAQTAYTANSIDFLTLIDAARTYRDLQMAYYESQAQLGILFAQLERLVGVDLVEK